MKYAPKEYFFRGVFLFLEYFVSDLPKLGINCYFCCNHTIASQTEPLKKWIILFPSKSILS